MSWHDTSSACDNEQTTALHTRTLGGGLYARSRAQPWLENGKGK
jgi:hypothetical protein